ncbi:MAG TPA: hypothetical protein VFE96_05830 [Candidatus Bathyarchaeia archaeon]|nr:hypothetical protein [Candidatus Bathyarchaeia archaeon]
MPLNVGEDFIHSVLVMSSVVLVIIASRAYLRRHDSRYLFLLLAFVFLGISQVVTLLEALSVSGPIFLPFIEVHLSHMLDFLMLLSFALSLTRSVDAGYDKRDSIRV